MSESTCTTCGAPAGPDHLCANADGPPLGTVLDGRYEIVGLLGHGGMGVVFEATQKSMHRPVAVKTLHPRLAKAPTFFERFRLEADVASHLRHPNIINIYDFGRTPEGLCYYVMELLFGESLRQVVKREGPLSLARSVGIIEQVAKALTHAHREGVVHRDLKPHNIMVQPLDGADFVKVLDFGLVKALGPSDGEELTHAGQVVGTPQYMPPEQAGGEAVDPRSDLWAMAAVLHHCLTGSPPFGAKTVQEAREAALSQPVPLVNPKRSGAPIPEDLEAFLQRGLAPNPDERFQDAEEFLRELRLAVASVTQSEFHARPELSGPTTFSSTLPTGSGSALGQGAGSTSQAGAAVAAVAKQLSDALPSFADGLARPSSRLVAFVGVPAVLFIVGAGLVYAARDSLFPSPPPPAVLQPPPEVVVPEAQVEYEPLPAPVVRLESVPPGATVTEGDTVLGKTPVDAALSLEREYFLTFRLTGHEPVTRRVSPGETKRLEVRLSPAGASKPPVERATKKTR